MNGGPLLRDWLACAPYTLALSSGFFGFFAHFGCLAALEEASLAPAGISGSSAGALAGTVWAAGGPVSALESQLFNLTKRDFWDPAPGLGLLKGDRFRKLLTRICLVEKIEQCTIPLAISAFDLSHRTTRSFRRGTISEVVYASCCVPLLFQPIRIGNSLYLDGGLSDRPGLAGVPVGSRTLCHDLRSSWPYPNPQQRFRRILDQRPHAVAISVNGIASVHPGSMERGRLAFDQTRASIHKALGRPVGNRLMCL
jgi:NTE family protein